MIYISADVSRALRAVCQDTDNGFMFVSNGFTYLHGESPKQIYERTVINV